MKQFTYKTKNSQGKLVSGSIGAQTESDAVAELRRRGLTVMSLKQARGGSASKGGSSIFKMSLTGKGGSVKGNVKMIELVVATRQLATMVSAGIPLVEGLEIIEEQTTSPVLHRVLAEVVEL